ncbi:DUF4019 domain-containing protein [Stenotrophomonas sp. SY1]|uniref:DUF4019 domain-containing protein n=1 Tax=Stenotrophomonas sp. SY1 TaxID=477235 RepID=UPI001E50BC8D|nr:DUF4019 domain-containing protein [Stenotrophomonas sp. SY1]MCD9086339.1 DUF4019 domain-containing protein [Stenotrophomonas sp. SY1]
MLSLGLSTSAVLAQTAPAAAPPAATPGARAPATPAIAPAQQAQLAKQDADMTRAAQQVAQLVDAQQAGQVWDGASAVARKAVTREAFANSVNGDRSKLGALVSRGKPSITRVQYPAGAAVPEGIYLNVSFPTRFANNAQPVRELVSFRLDEDKVWRASGYSVRAAN